MRYNAGFAMLDVVFYLQPYAHQMEFRVTADVWACLGASNKCGRALRMLETPSHSVIGRVTWFPVHGASPATLQQPRRLRHNCPFMHAGGCIARPSASTDSISRPAKKRLCTKIDAASVPRCDSVEDLLHTCDDQSLQRQARTGHTSPAHCSC